MAHHIEWVNGVVWLAFQHQITKADLVEIAKVIEQIEEEHEISPDRLTDMGDVEGIDFEVAAVDSLAGKRREAKLKNPVKSVIVAPKEFLFGYARMFQTMNDHADITIEVFRDMPAALEWLGVEAPASRQTVSND